MSILGCNSNSIIAVFYVLYSSVQYQARIIFFQELLGLLNEDIFETSLINHKLVTIRTRSKATAIRSVSNLSIIA
jgi:hypothetical protein